MTLFRNLSHYLPSSALSRIAALTLSATLLTACSGGGAEVTDNPVQTAPPSATYTGPAPQTDDVQSFKLNVWDKLSPDNRCGGCHGIDQTPTFVFLDDVNIAYAEANKIVDLSNPSESRMVTKVGSGHHCWLSSAQACADTVTNYIAAWAGDAAGGGTTIQLLPPEIRDPGASKTFPATSDLFAATVYPELRQYCAGCHDENSANPISPFFANEDVDSAYEFAKARINLDDAAGSRFVVRLRSEFHNCWSDCTANSDEMESVIQAFIDQIPLTEVDPALLTSKALRLTDGIVASGGGRYDASVIAMWNFKAGTGFEAFDTSGVEPSITLNLSGDVKWVGGWGIQIAGEGAKAQGSTASSKKLHDLITATGEYSIEAWVIPANVTQEGPAGIVSYSASTTNRNFTLGQTLYNYNFQNRSSETDANGDPMLSTADADEILQTALQHVVATFSPTSGRQIWVNGELVASESVETGGTLGDWDDSYAFILGNEASGDRTWLGTIKMVAIHNRALNQEQILQNFDAGVGEKFLMLFSISDLINLPDSYIVYEASIWDNYGYLFTNPFFINLNDGTVPDGIDVEKIRIAVNGREVVNGQAYRNLAVNLNGNDYNPETGQPLSKLGTVIGLEKGPDSDEFFLTFEKIGSQTHAFVEPPVPPAAAPVDLPARPDIGIRDFAEINATFSQVTGIPTSQSDVLATFETVKQQMPTLTDIDVFSSSQQMGITQLAIEYCNALVNDTSKRASLFTGFDFNAPANTAFDSAAKRDQIYDPLISGMMGTGLTDQPTPSEVKTELDSLITKLTACGGSCSADRTEVVVKAVCAATIGNAAMLVQ